MIKILSKAKKLSDGEWVVGYYVRLESFDKKKISNRIYTGYAETDCDDFYPEWHEIDLETLCPFTGLYDDDCKRIFEYDILRVCGDVNGIYIVSYQNGAFLLFTPKNTGPCEYLGSGFSTYEVIGNIYDEEKQK